MSDTNTFKVTYASGLTSETTSTCQSVEEFCNEHFGSAWETAKEHGATIEVVSDGVAIVVTEEEHVEVETKQSADGTTATGTAPLPDESPAQQDSNDATA